MDYSKLDPQWVLAQGIAVFVCVALMALMTTVVALLLRVIVKELRALQSAQAETTKKYAENTGSLIGAIRWLGEQIRAALKIAPPASPDEGFHAHRRKNDIPKRPPGSNPPEGNWRTPTPTPRAINPDDLLEKPEDGPVPPDPFQ